MREAKGGKSALILSGNGGEKTPGK